MIKFIYRFIIQLVSFFCIQIPIQLVGAVAIFLYLFCTRNQVPQQRLPYLLRWFDCADLYPEFNRSPITYLTLILPQGWWARYIWLAWRNPINYFEYKYLSYKFTGEEDYIITNKPAVIPPTGKIQIGDSTGCVPGYRSIELDTGAYEYLYVKRIGLNACFYFRMGYKIKDTKNKPGDTCQHVFTVSYRSYSGLK